jgi:hypothetical protein
MEGLVEDALSSDLLRKKSGLERLLSEIRKNRGGLAMSNLSKFFTMLKERLSEADWDVANLTLQITQEIIPVSSI